MTMPRFEAPEPVLPPEKPEVISAPEEVEVEESESVEDLSDITHVSREDVMGKQDANSDPYETDVSDLTSLSDEDMDEVLGVDEEDIMGEVSEPEESEAPAKRRLIQRTGKKYRPYIPQPPKLGGIRD